MDAASILEGLSALFRIIAFTLLYIMIGFGPGFIIGLLLANKILGKNLPLRMDKHFDSIRKAGEHNSQWHPDNPRWK